ncbi:MAG: hypothetical protein LBC62_10220, partial [Treponema sp.]|nr:hypothetical protein [Treponema sp.]
MFGSGKIRALPAAVVCIFCVVSVALFTTCKQTVGFGTEIDFTPPVLTLDPGPNPRYVREGSVLEGTVTDNMAVTEVVITDESDPARYLDGKFPVIARAVISGNRWRAELHFTPDRNGDKIAAVITAYDKMRNAGENSIQTINLIVDISPPVFSGVEIVRAPAYGTLGRLERLEDNEDKTELGLKTLEKNDPKANDYRNVNAYQNGWFYIRAHVSEMETNIGQDQEKDEDNTVIRVDQVYMNIYDPDHDTEGQELLQDLTRDESMGSRFTPYWLIKTEDLIREGDDKGWDYSKRLAEGERLYF